MDAAFADALAVGSKAIRDADPNALAAIEGGQVPGRGGWDYARLPLAVDLIEGTTGGGTIQIARSVNPGLIMLSTSFGVGPQETWSIWREALMGIGGKVIWDAPPMLGPDGALSERGRSLAPTLTTLTQGLGAQLLASAPRFDPIAILYSPASQRMQWLLDRRTGGNGWVARTAEVESGNDDAMRRLIGQTLDQLQHLAVQPHFLTPAMLAGGALEQRGIRVLVLPRALSLSAAEIAAIRRFCAQGGKIVSDGAAGVFDEHGRARPTPAFATLPGLPATIGQMNDLLGRADIEPILRITTPEGRPAQGVQVHLLRNGTATIAGIQADFVQGAAPRQIVVVLPTAMSIQNMRGGGSTSTDRLPLTLDPVLPALLAISPSPLPRPVLGIVSPGRTTRIVLSLSTPSPAAVHMQQVELIRPDGSTGGSFRVPLAGALATPTLTFAPTDPAGVWIIRARDMLGSGQVEARLSLPPPAP